ncbi:MAG: type II toxin-antitoxin system HicB family antitoxin [Planctomycetes bacterium]|nr:type II toxin-antitoxin system HicB family antitoxin [Planctomycetota bacterium]
MSDPAEPFRPSILPKARAIARDYKLTIERSERLGYIGSAVEMPTVFADGDTPEKCYQATQEALSVAVATMLESGQTPPQPAGFMKRTTQVNIRLTHEEKAMIASAAAKSGFKGLGDFIRTTVLDRALFNR